MLSPTTPITVRQPLSVSNLMRFPSADWPGHVASANDLFTRTTPGASARSVSATSRPMTIGICIVAKYWVVTRLITICGSSPGFTGGFPSISTLNELPLPLSGDARTSAADVTPGIAEENNFQSSNASRTSSYRVST